MAPRLPIAPIHSSRYIAPRCNAWAGALRRTGDARDLLEGLAARFPNTLLASQVEEALRALPVGEPVEN